jgi:DNA-binding phage protein
MLSVADRERGQRLGALLREARAERSMVDIAALSGVPVETLRKIESGRIPTPAFFTVAALAATLGLRLEDVAVHCDLAARGDLAGGASGSALTA